MAWPVPVEPPLPDGYAADPDSRRRFERPYLPLRALGVLVMLGGLGAFFLLQDRLKAHGLAGLLGLFACWFGGLLLLLATVLVQSRSQARCARAGKTHSSPSEDGQRRRYFA